MEQIPKIAEQRIQRLQATASASTHPDAGLLTAFAEKSLEDRERSQVLQHLAQCVNCREVLSLAMPELPPVQDIQPGFSGLRWLRWPVLRWAALAACFVVVGTMFTRRLVVHKLPASSAVNQGQQQTRENQYPMEATIRENDVVVAKADTPSSLQKRDLNGVRSRAKVVARQAQSEALGAASPAMSLPRNEKTLVSKNLAEAKKVPPETEAVEVAAAPAPSPAAPSAKAANAVGQTTQQVENRSADALPSSVSETVQVTAEAPAVETAQLAPGKAKDSKKALEKNPQLQADAALQRRDFTQLDKLTPATKWSLSAQGAVERSLDAGKSWQPVPVADHVVFRAVSALDSEIWVGGAAGALYHSWDGGQTWVQVKLSASGTPLTADIISLQFADVLNGKLGTADHQTWITADGGVSWQRQ